MAPDFRNKGVGSVLGLSIWSPSVTRTKTGENRWNRETETISDFFAVVRSLLNSGKGGTSPILFRARAELELSLLSSIQAWAAKKFRKKAFWANPWTIFRAGFHFGLRKLGFSELELIASFKSEPISWLGALIASPARLAAALIFFQPRSDQQVTKVEPFRFVSARWLRHFSNEGRCRGS